MTCAHAPSSAIRIDENSLSYPGWRVAFVCHIGVLAGFATVFIYSFSFMVKPPQQEFGWNREQVARAFSLAAISVAICSPFIGRLFDRIEPRKLIASLMAALGLGLASLAYLTSHLMQLYASAIFIGIAGTGTYQLGYARIVTTWFERRLGVALSLVVTGSGVGSLLIPPLVEHLIRTYGWRHTYLVLGAIPLFVGAPLTLLFARSRKLAPTLAPAAEPADSVGVTWPQAVRSLSFWLLVLGVFALSLSENGTLAHLAPMMSDLGFAPRDIAYIASILGASSVTGRFVLGWLLDYLKGSLIASASLICAGGGIPLLTHARSFSTAAPAAFIAGLGAGCELDLIPYMLRRYFGLRSFATLYGLVYSFFAVSGASAPLIAGHVYDVTGSYTRTLNGFAGATLIAALAVLALPAYRYTSHSSNKETASAANSSSLVIPTEEAALESN